jgi:hypothetical protein
MDTRCRALFPTVRGQTKSALQDPQIASRMAGHGGPRRSMIRMSKIYFVTLAWALFQLSGAPF